MPFNSEQVARAVVGVSGAGRHRDRPRARHLDRRHGRRLRASTPTAAAEAVSPSHEQLVLTLVRERRALATALQNRVKSAAQQVRRLAERPVLRDPHAVLGPVAQAIDMAGMRLARAIPERIARDAQRVDYVRGRLLRAWARPCWIVPVRRWPWGRPDSKTCRRSAFSAGGMRSASRADGKTVVKSVADVMDGDAVRVRVGDGHIDAQVTDLIPLED